MVIQTGTIAAVAVAFARFFGVLIPWISESRYIIPPIHVSQGYAISLSRAQLVGVALIALLTWTNTRGLEYGRIIQNIFTTAKTGALIGLILVGVLLGWNGAAVADNFGNLWTARVAVDVVPGLSAITVFGLFVAVCVSQTGSLFSADAWNNITFTAGEVKEPRRNIPLSLALGTFIVIGLYLLANVAYLNVLPAAAIATAPQDRVGTAALQAILGDSGLTLMAAAIMISTFGCNNGLILSGARVYYAMARDDLFFQSAGVLHPRYKTPAVALIVQAVWTSLLCLSGTYTQLLNFVIFAALVFYGLTAVGLFALRAKRPTAARPVRVPAYPWLPALYVVATAVIAVDLLAQDATRTYSFLGLALVVCGVPVYYAWRRMVRRRSALPFP
jgi:APA family basic amino acid/polyamine antiporter